MAYADILINIKTSKQDFFTYSIPADILPYINIGSVVEVNFRNKKVVGIVIKLKKRTKGLAEKKIKPIVRVIDSRPIIDQDRLKTAQWASNYYFSSLGKVLFALLPQPARREGEKEFIKKSKAVKKTNKNSKVYLLNLGFKQRVEAYIKLIKRNKKKGGQTILLLPNIHSPKTKYLLSKLDNYQIYHSSLNRTEKYKIWKRGQTGKTNLIIGTRQALFLPLPNLKLVIIDQSTESLYKNQQEPFLDYRDLAVKLAQNTDASLVFGDQLPFLKHYFKNKSNSNWKTLADRTGNSPSVNTIIVNLNKEKSLISQPLAREINKVLDSKNKSLLYLNRKGDRNIAICLDCQKSHYSVSSKREACQACGSKNIKFSSMGIKGLAKTIKNNFSQAKIKTLSSNSSISKINKLNRDKFDILISTSTINNYYSKYSLVSLILPDISFNLPSYNSSEKSFYDLYKTLSLSKNRSIIQTFNPEDPFFKYLANFNYHKFYQQLIKTRKKTSMPPFSNLIRIYSRKKPYQISLSKTRKSLLNNIEDNPKYSKVDIKISQIIQPIFFKWPYFLINYPKDPKTDLGEIFESIDSSIKIERDPIDLI